MKNKWVLYIFLITFVISVFLGLFSNVVINNLSITYAFLLLLLIIFIGVFFDIIGVAVVSDIDKHHNSRASKKVRGSKESLFLLKHKDKVSNVANDVIGDVCGILSGAIGAVIAIYIYGQYNTNIIMTNLIIASFIAAITVGFKAIGKGYAIKHKKIIVEKLGFALSLFYRIK